MTIPDEEAVKLPVIVKPLEWGDRKTNTAGDWTWGAKTSIGWYIASTASGERCKGSHFWFIVGETISAWANSEAEAKAAAQADYTRRIMSALSPTTPDTQAPGSGETFQNRVAPWMQACFGPEISNDRLERGDRMLEELLEALQSGDYPEERVAALTKYTYSRPKGEPFQEIGGVMVTVAAYCLAHGIDMHAAAEAELARIWTKVDKIRAKQAAKPTGSALPVAFPPDHAMLASAPSASIGAMGAGEITVPARDGFEAQRGINDIPPGDPYPISDDLKRGIDNLRAKASRGGVTSAEVFAITDPLMDLLVRSNRRQRPTLPAETQAGDNEEMKK